MDTSIDRPLRFLSLCSGIGGIDLAAQEAGFEIVGQCEIDPYCQAVLAKHWPDVKRLSDIRHVQGDEFGHIDIMAAGFPCQPHSLAGKRQASRDERDLWPEIKRLLGAIKPRWFVGENVYGLLTTESAGFFGSILRDLDSLGYRVFWSVYGACDIGAPHRRERVFIVAHSCQPGARVETHRGRGQGRQHTDTSQPTLVRQELWAIGTEGLGAGSTSAMADPSSVGRDIRGDHRQGRRVPSDIGTPQEVQQERQGWLSRTSQASPTLADSTSRTQRIRPESSTELPERDTRLEFGSSSEDVADSGIIPQLRQEQQDTTEHDRRQAWLEPQGENTMGYPDGERCQEQQPTTIASPSRWTCGTDATRELAYPTIEGLEGRQWQELQGGGIRPPIGSQGLADTESEQDGRVQQSRVSPDLSTGSVGQCESGVQLEPCVCRNSDGLSRRMEQHRWPSTPGQPQEEWEPPRIISEKQPYRNQRLKALGNAVVPQQVYPVLKAIADIEMAREEVAV